MEEIPNNHLLSVETLLEKWDILQTSTGGQRISEPSTGRKRDMVRIWSSAITESVRSSFMLFVLSFPHLRTFLAQRNDTSSLAKKMKNPSKAMSCPSWKGYRLLALNREKKRQNSTLVILWNPKTNHLEPWHWLINQHPIKWTLLKFTSTWNPQDPPIWKKGWPFS